MYEGRLEDDFNAWVMRVGNHEFGLDLHLAKDEDCWVATTEHKDKNITCSNCDEIIKFLEHGKKQGYISRYWFEDIYDEHMFKIGKKIAFCYNG